MKKFLIAMLLCFQSLCSASESLDTYFSCIKQLNQSKGDFKRGEIELVTDPSGMALVQKTQEERLIKKGFSPSDAKEFSRIGIAYEDQYWIWLRDAVYFPKGVSGTYNRLIWKPELQGGFSGVAVLPVLPSGKIALNLNYRHATRSWELELPRGCKELKETREEAALREVKEETGLVASSLTFLGEMAPDTGVLSSVIPIFIGKIAATEVSHPKYSEAIAGVLSFTKEELKEGLLQGYLEVTIEGEKKQVPLRDSFLTFAIFQAELRKLL